jgi:hypothetical protein
MFYTNVNGGVIFMCQWVLKLNIQGFDPPKQLCPWPGLNLYLVYSDWQRPIKITYKNCHLLLWASVHSDLSGCIYYGTLNPKHRGGRGYCSEKQHGKWLISEKVAKSLDRWIRFTDLVGDHAGLVVIQSLSVTMSNMAASSSHIVEAAECGSVVGARPPNGSGSAFKAIG